MGLIRKAMSVGTVGIVDFRSDKERIAAYTKASKKQAKKQTEIMRRQLAAQQRELVVAGQAPSEAVVQPTPTPAGWYPNGNCLRYWDGIQWTNHAHPLPQAPAPAELEAGWLPSN